MIIGERDRGSFSEFGYNWPYFISAIKQFLFLFPLEYKINIFTIKSKKLKIVVSFFFIYEEEMNQMSIILYRKKAIWRRKFDR